MVYNLYCLQPVYQQYICSEKKEETRIFTYDCYILYLQNLKHIGFDEVVCRRLQKMNTRRL
jgi:hypothetical protein